MILACGVSARGYLLTHKAFHVSFSKESFLFAGMLKKIYNFCENAVSAESTQLEIKNYVIIIHESVIRSSGSFKLDRLISYAILRNDKKVNNEIKRYVLPLLKKITSKFISIYNGSNLADPSQFESFEREIKKILGSQTNKFDERLTNLIY